MPIDTGLNRKHPQLHIPVKRLLLDKNNPRLSEESQGRLEQELLRVLYKDFNLDELAESMAQNGYFDEEPLVAIPSKLPKVLEKAAIDSEEFKEYIQQDETEFIVVEGNRRLATVKLLLSIELQESLRIRKWPSITDAVRKDLSSLPIIVYQNRVDVIPYLGVRHIVGIQRWDSFAKARYIAGMIQDGSSISDVENQIGDKSGTIVKNYICYKLIEQTRSEFDIDITNAKNNFSLLLLAIGQGNIKRFIGLPERLSDANFEAPTPIEKLENLKDLMIWIYGDQRKKAVIKESRDITKYLSYVVASASAVDYLKLTSNLEDAYERTDGEEQLLLRYLTKANRQLENALGLAPRYKSVDAIAEVKNCQENVKALLQIMGEHL